MNGCHGNSIPVQVEGSDLCIVSLKVREVEEVWRSFLFPSLPGTRAHKVGESAGVELVSAEHMMT